MNPRDIKRHAKEVRRYMIGTHRYDAKFKNLRVADVLIWLEDNNWHNDVQTIINIIEGKEL